MGEWWSRRWWARRSLRARLTLTATAVLAVGLAAGGVLLVTTVRASLVAALDNGALQTARDVAALVDAGRLSDPVPVGGPTRLVQVVDSRGRVLAASAGADRLVQLLAPGERAGGRPRLLRGSGTYGSPLRVVAVPAGSPANPRTVVVAVGVTEMQDSLRVVRNAVVIGSPVLLGVLAGLTWLMVGSALRPVEALRTGAEEITGAGGGQRLPLPAARDEIHRLAVTLNDMVGRLDGARRRQRAFVADAAHELRSPLASLRTQLEVTHRRVSGGGEPVSVAALEDMLTDTDRLSRLVDDLLLLARLDDTGAGAGRVGPVDVGDLASEVTTRYTGLRVPVGVSARGAAWVAGDPGQLGRVLANLLDNAVRHAAHRVEVTAAVQGSEVVVIVADDGAGIGEGDREQVFERFTRLDDARSRDSGGAGLGLAIVRDLVRRHGGTVTLGDGPGSGLQVEVRLPLLPR